jgi:tetratricopeptide (TPR) repeat protein
MINNINLSKFQNLQNRMEENKEMVEPPPPTPTVCLNMIVKDESKIICRLFDSVIKWIDCYCICDTGSTDDTVDRVREYFNGKNIPGKIVIEPFKDFSHNRNFSLQACLGMSDYVLLLDADMIFYLNEDLFSKKMLTLDVYYILQGSNDFYYKNLRIVKNNGNFSYAGLTHEYINFPPNATVNTFEKNVVFIYDVGDGGSKGNKFIRDVDLLTRGIEENPQNDRYHFYLANTLKDLGKREEAIEMYKKRIAMGGWNEEIWYSYYKMGTCYKELGKMLEAIDAWLSGYNILPNRVENIYEIIKYYREVGKHPLSYLFYNIAKEIILACGAGKDDYLFLENDVYTYKCDYEYTIIAYYLGLGGNVTNIRHSIINVINNCNNFLIVNLFQNMKFYDLKLFPLVKRDISFTLDYEIKGNLVHFNSSSSSILPKRNCDGSGDSGGGYIMNVRLVNYTINSEGGYETGQHIISLNKYVELTDDFHVIKEKDKLIGIEYADRQYIGVEDVRLFYDSFTSSELLFIGVGYHEDNKIGVVHGKYDGGNGNALKPFEIKPEFNLDSSCEKNWVFANIGGQKCVIYDWCPFRICKIDEENPNVLKTVSLKQSSQYPGVFNHIRGSTCGFNYCDQIWFIVHIVSHEQPHHYYHMMLVFENNENMKLIKYTPIFKFDEHCIEYCVGLIVEDSRIIATYSTMDASTKIAIYDKVYIEEMMINFV